MAGVSRDRRWGQHTYDIGDSYLPPEFRTLEDSDKNKIGNASALRGKLHFEFTESGQHKVGIINFDFPADHGLHPPTAELREFDVSAELNLKFPEGMCSGSIHLVESMDELFAVCICYVDFDVGNIGAVLIYKMGFSGGESMEELVVWDRVDDIGDRAFLLTELNMATWC